MLLTNTIEVGEHQIPFKIGGYSLALFLKKKNIKLSSFTKELEDDLTLLYEVIYLGVCNGYKREGIQNPFTLEQFADLVDDYNAMPLFSEELSNSMSGNESDEKNGMTQTQNF